MSSTLKETMNKIKVPYMPIECFDESKILKKIEGDLDKEDQSLENFDKKIDLSDHVSFILHGMGMGKYVELFKKEQVLLETFLQLNEDDLKELGITNSKDREIISKNLELHLPSRKEFVVSENHVEDLSIIKNVCFEVILLQNYCAYLELQMKKHRLSDYRINNEEFACTYLKAFAESALKQNQILCCKIYDELDSDTLIDKILKAYALTLPESLEEEYLPKKKKKFSIKIMVVVGLGSLGILMGKYLMRKGCFKQMT